MYNKKQDKAYFFKGKFNARFELLTEKEAEENPAGLGRDEPNGLIMPKYYLILSRIINLIWKINNSNFKAPGYIIFMVLRSYENS